MNTIRTTAALGGGVGRLCRWLLQLWAYGGGANQQWKPVRQASGRYHFIARHSGKCLSAPASAAAGVQLVQRTCDGSAAQSYHLVTQG